LEQKCTADIYSFREYAGLYKFLYSTIYAMKALGGSQYAPNDLIGLSGRDVDATLLMDLHQLVLKARAEFISEGNIPRKLHRRADYYTRVYQEIFPNKASRDVGAIAPPPLSLGVMCKRTVRPSHEIRHRK